MHEPLKRCLIGSQRRLVETYRWDGCLKEFVGENPPWFKRGGVAMGVGVGEGTKLRVAFVHIHRLVVIFSTS